MSVPGSVSMTFSLPGVSIQATVSKPSSGGLPAQSVSVLNAAAGTLTTRTDNTNGTLTLGANHGISNADIITIFDDNTGTVSYLATVGTVAGNSVPFTGAAGAVLPVVNSTVTVGKVVDLDVDFDGDNVRILAAQMTTLGHVVFEDAGNTAIANATLTANQPWMYIDGVTASNPLTGNAVDQIRLANGNSASNGTFKLGGTYNSEA